MKKYGHLIIASLLFTQQLQAVSYVPFEFLNKLKVPVVFMVGTKKQGDFTDRLKEVASDKASTDMTEIDNDQPTLRLYLKDKPGQKYTFEFNTEGKNQIKIRVVEDHGIIRLEPQTGWTSNLSSWASGGAIKGNVSQEDIIRVTPTTSVQPMKKPMEDKKPIPGARPPQRPSLLIEAIIRGDSLNKIKRLFTESKVGNINEKDEQDNTALYYAQEFAEFERQKDDQEIVKLLKSKGAR